MAHFKTNDNTVEKILFQEEVGTYSSDTGNIYYQSKITDLFKPVVNEVKRFRNKVRDAFNGKLSNYSQITVLDNTPKVFTKIGLQDKPVRISYGVLKKVNIEKHNVPMNVIEDLPNLISDPVAIFKSKTDNNSYVAVLDAKDNSDRMVVSIMKSTSGNYNVIPSVYGKDNFENFIINNLKENNLLYLNENKADVIRPSSLQLLGVYNTNLSNNNYITKEDIVNTNITTTEDTILNQNAIRTYENHIAKINASTEQNCKSKQEWRDEEIFYTKNEFYPLRHKSAEELQERYQSRLYHYQKSEDNILQKIKETEERITELTYQISVLEKQHFPRKLKRKQNKLAWAKKRLFELERYLFDNKKKQRRYEYLFNKWNGIIQKIILANITLRISEEKKGNIAPYYGFNDNRETSKYIHEDYK